MLLFFSSLFLTFNLDCTSNKFNKVKVEVTVTIIEQSQTKDDCQKKELANQTS